MANQSLSMWQGTPHIRLGLRSSHIDLINNELN